MAGPVFSAEQKKYDKEVSFTRQIFNFHVVAPGIMRGSQPSAEALGLLRDYCGVKTILSLRPQEAAGEWEQEKVEALGMKFVRLPMDGSEEQAPETIDACLAVLTDKANQPVFVHCQAGKDRTGLVCAAYRMAYDSWSLQDAVREMLVYGYDRGCCSNLEKSLAAWNERRLIQKN